MNNQRIFRSCAAILSFAGLALLAACRTAAPPAPLPAPPPPPERVPVVLPAPPALPVPEKPWDVAPLSSGDWAYRQDGARTMIWFGASPATVTLSISCDRAQRRIAVSRSGGAGGPAVMTIRTSAGDLSWGAAPGEGAFAEMIATRPANDPGFDWIAFSRGRMAIELPGTQRLIVPVWAEISRVIEDCRG